jgi:hypothetical protein
MMTQNCVFTQWVIVGHLGHCTADGRRQAVFGFMLVFILPPFFRPHPLESERREADLTSPS